MVVGLTGVEIMQPLPPEAEAEDTTAVEVRVTQVHQGHFLVVRAAGDRVILGWQHPPQTHKETMVLVGQAAQQLILVIQSTSLARMLAGTEAKVGQPPQVEMVRVFTVWTAVLGLC